MTDFHKAIHKITAPIQRRIMNAICRGVLNLIDDTTGFQTVQTSLLAGEIKDGLERIQNYGFTSVPLPGAECLAVFVGGNRDHGLVIAADDRATRLKGLLPGDVAVYTPSGNYIILRYASPQIQILAASGLEITAPVNITGAVVITGDLSVSGNISDGVRSMAADRVKYNSHIHTDPQGGVTGTPTPTE